MQTRTVTKLLVEVNMLSRLTHEQKPAGLNAKEIYNDVEDIYARLVKLNNKIAKAKKDESAIDNRRHPARPPAPVVALLRRVHRTIYEANNGED